MTTTPMAYEDTTQPSGDPVLVMVASRDDAVRARLRATVRFLPDIEVVDVDSAEHAIATIEGLYECPRGCPDVLALDPALPGARRLRARLRRSCPGVRVAQVTIDDAAGIAKLRDLVRGVQAAFA